MNENDQNKSPSLEDNFLQIEDIIDKMEKQDISLEESFSLFQQGIVKLKECNDMLDAVEKKMQIIGKDGEPEEFI